MDSSDITRKKMGRVFAGIKLSPANTINKGQVPNNPPLTPSDNTFIASQYPKTKFALNNNLFPCGSNLYSTIYTTGIYATGTSYYYNNTNGTG